MLPLIAPQFKEPIDLKILKERVLPVLDKLNQSYKSALELQGQLLLVVYILRPWYNFDSGTSLAGLIKGQIQLQTAFSDLKDTGYFKYLMTTAGFEHEFADMFNSPLAGVSHIELAKSEEKMPLTKIPFIVETDASNALELVSPPFLLPTVGAAPLPDPGIVRQIDEIMRKELSGLTPSASPKEKLLGNSPSIAFGKMMGDLCNKTGLRFVPTNMELKPEHISHKADPAKLATSLEGHKEEEKSDSLNKSSDPTLHIKPSILDKIEVGESSKASNEKYSVSSQLNFATDLDTASHMMVPSTVSGAKVYLDLESEMAAAIKIDSLKQSGTRKFSGFMVKQLCGLFSIFSQNHLKVNQANFYKQVQKEVASKGTGGPQISGTAQKEFQLHAGLCSYVKDSTVIWVKDHLVSLASGVLKTKDDYVEAFELAQAAHQFAKTWALPGGVKAYLLQKGHTDPDAHWSDFQFNLLTTIPSLLSSLDPEGGGIGSIADESPDVDLYGHNKKFIGARQDTYLDPGKVQQPGLWGSRLHVAEIRRGNPADQLEETAKKL